MPQLRLQKLPETYMVCKLASDAAVPSWAMVGTLNSITKTTEELSIVCQDQVIPKEISCERGWVVLKVAGPLDFALTGILAAITEPLAKAQISIFAISTFDTDYVLVKEETLAHTIDSLTAAGHTIDK
jgi:uncharacterized protein